MESKGENMFCKYCGQEIENKKSVGKSVEDNGCDECVAVYGNRSQFVKRPVYQYCVECGTTIHPLIIIPSNGKSYLRVGNTKLCEQCQLKKRPPKKVNSKPKKVTKSGVPYITKPQMLAHAYANRKPSKLTILYECPCISDKKHKHHFDYTRPLEVILLCSPCHHKEHVRLRSLGISTNKHLAITG